MMVKRMNLKDLFEVGQEKNREEGWWCREAFSGMSSLWKLCLDGSRYGDRQNIDVKCDMRGYG